MGLTTPSALAKLLDDASLEITAKDVEKLAEARAVKRGCRDHPAQKQRLASRPGNEIDVAPFSCT
jgi:hypothetical protein